MCSQKWASPSGLHTTWVWGGALEDFGCGARCRFQAEGAEATSQGWTGCSRLTKPVCRDGSDFIVLFRVG